MSAEISPELLALLTPENVEGELCRRSFREYVHRAWHIVQPAEAFMSNWHIDAICEHLQAVSEGQIRFLWISIAPRHSKSLTACVFWPTWDWIRKPSRQWLFGAYSLDLATRDAVRSRRLMDSKWYQDRWGCKCKLTPHFGCTCGERPHALTCERCTAFRMTTDQNVKTLYENDRTGRRLTASVEAGTTGEGGDIIALDDPLDLAKASSAIVRKGAVDYVEKVFMHRMNDPRKSAFVGTAQRADMEDVAAWALGTGLFTHLCLPTEYEVPPQVDVTSIGFRDPRTEPGQLLWPERFGEQEVARAKLNPTIFATQHQQRPSIVGGGLFRREWWRMWHPAGDEAPTVRDPVTSHVYEIVKPPKTYQRQIQSWDTSVKKVAADLRKGRQPDPYSGGVWGQSGPDCYLLDRVNKRLDIMEACDEIVAMTVRFPLAITKLIEAKANGPAIMQQLRHRVAGLHAVDPKNNKVDRATMAPTERDKDARALSTVALVKGGNVILPHPAIAPWVWDYITEFAAFPTGANDDDVDMTSQALSFLQPWVWRSVDDARREAEEAEPRNLQAEFAERIHGWIKESLDKRQREFEDRAQRGNDMSVWPGL